MTPGVEIDAFMAGLGLGFLVAFAAWLPLALVALLRRLLSMT